MNAMDLFIARTQAWTFVLWSMAFLGFLYVIVFFHTQLDDTIEKLVYVMLGVIGSKVGEQSSFFFQRQRAIGLPDPTTTTTTTSSTTTPTPLVVPPGTTATTAPAQPVVITPTPPEVHP